MKLTVKKISDLTGISPAGLRKWRERFNILQPVKASNGYFYYTSEDYRVLMALKNRLAKGEKLAKIVKEGRDALLHGQGTPLFDNEQWQQIEIILGNDFTVFESIFSRLVISAEYATLIQEHIHPLTLLVGKAWESGFITVGTEHAFSRWLSGYLLQLSRKIVPKPDTHRLYISFPGDAHELGSMMYYILQAIEGKSGKFCGMLPINLVLEELDSCEFAELYVSAVLPLTQEKIDTFENSIRKSHPDLKIFYGGYGLNREAKP